MIQRKTQLTCLKCGATFKMTGTRDKYCRKCRRYPRPRKIYEHTCRYCLKLFKTRDYRWHHCSSKCSRLANIRRAAVAFNRRPKKKNHAIEKVAIAIKTGRLHRSPICLKCGRETFTQGHHPDYSKPLNVVWLCRTCHKRLHYHNDGKVHPRSKK